MIIRNALRILALSLLFPFSSAKAAAKVDCFLRLDQNLVAHWQFPFSQPGDSPFQGRVVRQYADWRMTMQWEVYDLSLRLEMPDGRELRQSKSWATVFLHGAGVQSGSPDVSLSCPISFDEPEDSLRWIWFEGWTAKRSLQDLVEKSQTVLDLMNQNAGPAQVCLNVGRLEGSGELQTLDEITLRLDRGHVGAEKWFGDAASRFTEVLQPVYDLGSLCSSHQTADELFPRLKETLQVQVLPAIERLALYLRLDLSS